MPSLASFLHRMRRNVAGWLLPEIEDLLLQRINQESDAAGERNQEAAEVPTAFLASRQPPPEDWLARVREGAPQLLLNDDAGGLPSVRLGGLAGREAFVADTSSQANPIIRNRESFEAPVDSHQPAEPQHDQQTPVESNELNATPARNVPLQLDDARPAPRPRRAAAANLPTARQRIASALHAAARMVAGEESRTSRKPSAAAEVKVAEPASRARIQREDRPEQVREAASVKASDRIEESRPSRSRATPTGLEDSRKQPRSADTHSQRDSRQLPPPKVVIREERVVTRFAAKHPPQESPGIPPSPRSRAGLEPRQEFPAREQRIAEHHLDQQVMAVPHPARRVQSIPDLVPPTIRSRELARQASQRLTAADRPSRATRNRPNRWPALMASRQERESLLEGLHAQQRHTMLRREQAGVD